ncbi:amidase [Reticulibacter mediterranei]|uniref:Amidase n=1 Tax=Reticulibacter mediterranei TaxID=2778369 RepID=A0A8J3N0V3_9CHLR|nr:amidase [Reticulibacter mediterranei]GHO90677.1 amidase [Reticulibacter mediterranei]
MLYPAPLATTAAALHNGTLNMSSYIDELCDRIDQMNPLLEALLPEEDRRARLQNDAQALQARYPDPVSRPPLYGIPIGVKDTFRVDGFSTQAGSQLPPNLFAGTEAECVSLLRAAGALILGKTATTEFAYFEPGPTRNPHHLEHTPGGSSSGSVAAVAAGLCPLSLGTQVIGSTIRPAAYCGIFGFKPTYGRIPTSGLIRCADSVEHVGYFTQDLPGIELVASLLCSNWRSAPSDRQPILGVPDGPYLAQASEEALVAFERQLSLLQQGGYSIKRIAALQDIEEINRRHTRMVFAEMAQVHAAWFAQYESLYRPRTAAALREGQSVGDEEWAQAREGRITLRSSLEEQMAQTGIDMWVSPATTEPAPEGLHSTGSPIMNLPWTYTGMPAITLPAGHAANGLPLGLQCVSATMTDEYLLQWVAPIADLLASQFKRAG